MTRLYRQHGQITILTHSEVCVCVSLSSCPIGLERSSLVQCVGPQQRLPGVQLAGHSDREIERFLTLPPPIKLVVIMTHTK